MKRLTILPLLLFISSCASPGPSWVQGLLSGEQSVRVYNGSRILYRQLGQSCHQAFRKAEALISREYENAVPVLEVEWRTEDYCAVTVSIPSGLSQVKEVKYKIGTTRAQLMKEIKDYISIQYDYRSTCWREYGEAGYTVHGHTTICWKQLRIVGSY